MGTRGITGFVVGGQVKTSYNHSDSYPTWLGVHVLDFCREVVKKGRLDELKEKAQALIMVDEDSRPSPKLIKKYSKYHDENVAGGQVENWYSLLRDLQGEDGLKAVLNGETGHLLDEGDFHNFGLHCEWGYLINLDEGTLEVYKGFLSKATEGNRFGAEIPAGEDFLPIQLIHTFNLSELEEAKATMESLEEE